MVGTIEHILNECLNDALCRPGRIKNPCSNTIAEFVTAWLESKKSDLVTELRVVSQSWYETDCTKTGWDSHGWYFTDDGSTMPLAWTVVQYIYFDKFGNPTLGIAEREINITQQ